MKSGDRVRSAFLSALIADAMSYAKNDGNRDTTDDDVLKAVAKFTKGARETLKLSQAHGGSGVEAAQRELTWLANYAPAQLSEAELEQVIVDHVATLADGERKMPNVMTFLKKNYANRYDGKLASQLAKKILS